MYLKWIIIAWISLLIVGLLATGRIGRKDAQLEQQDISRIVALITRVVGDLQFDISRQNKVSQETVRLSLEKYMGKDELADYTVHQFVGPSSPIVSHLDPKNRFSVTFFADGTHTVQIPEAK